MNKNDEYMNYLLKTRESQGAPYPAFGACTFPAPPLL